MFTVQKKCQVKINLKILLDYKSERNVTTHLSVDRACVLLF